MLAMARIPVPRDKAQMLELRQHPNCHPVMSAYSAACHLRSAPRAQTAGLTSMHSSSVQPTSNAYDSPTARPSTGGQLWIFSEANLQYVQPVTCLGTSMFFEKHGSTEREQHLC